jgi:hypothetical protein
MSGRSDIYHPLQLAIVHLLYVDYIMIISNYIASSKLLIQHHFRAAF